MSPTYKKDKIAVLYALTAYPYAFEFANQSIMYDLEIVCKAVEKWDNVSDHLQMLANYNPKFILDLISWG